MVKAVGLHRGAQRGKLDQSGAEGERQAAPQRLRGALVDGTYDELAGRAEDLRASRTAQMPEDEERCERA